MSETQDQWKQRMAELDRANLAAGRCPGCGGSGVVANMRGIDRTGDPHLNKRCPKCRGTGKPRTERG